MKRTWIKPYEFWHPRLFEAPFYVYLLLQCLRYRVSLTTLAKANFALDHGEIGIGSKFHTQNQFSQRYFLPTELLSASLDKQQRVARIKQFAAEHGYPVILKPDIGMVGKGILKLDSDAATDARAGEPEGEYLLQQFTDQPEEYGVFYIRRNGVPKITGINRKHFPAVTGNGHDSILQLAKKHPRYTDHWSTFLQYVDTRRVPAQGEQVRLSFIGSHTMGCMFTDDTDLLTPELEREIFAFFSDQPGYNFGRMDVKTDSEAAFRRGEFTVIEVNGVSSLPTHMFDPDHSLAEAYRIFFRHGKYLVQIAREFRERPMQLLPLLQVAKRVVRNQGKLNQLHTKLKSTG